MNDGILNGARFITPGMIRRRFFNEPEREQRPKEVVESLKADAEAKRARRRERNRLLGAKGGFSGREPRGPKPICWKKERLEGFRKGYQGRG